MNHLLTYAIYEDASQWLENNLKLANERKLHTDGEFILLWHGTSPASMKNIMKTHRFREYAWFAEDESAARRYGMIKIQRGLPAVAMFFVHAGSVLPSGNYWTAQSELKEMPLTHGFWK